MNISTRRLLASAFVALSFTGLASAQSLTTIYAANNGGSFGGAVYFDVTVLNPVGIVVTSFDTNTNETLPMSMSVYLTPTTRVGVETNLAAWTLIASGDGVGQGLNIPTPVDTSDFLLGPGSYGIALVMSNNVGHDYTNGNGANQLYANADLQIDLGGASNAPFTGGIFDPRVWNGTLYYSGAGNNVGTYGVYGDGCVGSNALVPTLSGTPPLINNPYTVTVTNLPSSAPVGFVTLGFSKSAWAGGALPFDLGVLNAPGCSLLCDIQAAIGTANIGGSMTLTLGIPNSTNLLWFKIYNQGIVADITANGLGLTFSNGGEGVIGL